MHILAVLCSVLLAIQVTTAIPAGTGITHPPSLEPFEPAPFASHAQTPVASRGPFTWLRDSIIERIWAIDKGKKQCLNKPGPRPQSDKSWSRYGSDIVVRFEVHRADEVEALSEAIDILFLDVWDSTDEHVDIRLAKEVFPSLLGLLPRSLQKSHSLLIEDLSKVLYASQHSARGFRRPVSQSYDVADLFFDDYQPFPVLLQWMKLLVSMFPSHSELINVGYSYEGRAIPAMRLGVRPSGSESGQARKTVMIVGGSHAREWISTSTVAYIAFQLITEFGNSAPITRLLEDFDWILVPTINPDGYVYSWEMDRLWRKNRQHTGLSFCPGIDLDRSWGYEWDGEGGRANPCSESYAGNTAFESVETRSIAEWAYNQTQSKTTDFISFLDLHSYSQQILYPFSYSCSAVPPTLENLEELAFGLAKAIRVTNQETYMVRSACEGAVTSRNRHGESVSASVKSTGGSALDWFYHQVHARYSYQIKLRDKGMYGFLLPPEHIVPTGRELFNSILVLGHFLLGEGADDLEWQFIPGSESMGRDKESGFPRTFDHSFFDTHEESLDKPIDEPDYFSAGQDNEYEDEGWGLW